MAASKTTPLQMLVSLLAVCVAASAGLAATYAVTRERIAEQDRLAQEKAVKSVLPEAASFEAIPAAELAEAERAGGDTPVAAVWTAKDAGGEVAGWGIQVGPRGYGGPVNLVVGVDRTGKVTGVSVVSMNETPGLGTRVFEDKKFMAQFRGLDGTDIDAQAKKTDAITGATKSSRAVRRGVEAAGHVYAEVLAGGGGQ